MLPDRPEHIAVISSDQGLAKTVIDILTTAGLTCAAYGDLASMQQTGSAQPELLVLATQSLGDSELGLLSALREGSGKVQTLVVLRELDQQSAIALLHMGVGGCLRHPIVPEQLIERARSLVRLSRIYNLLDGARQQHAQQMESISALLEAMRLSPESGRMRVEDCVAWLKQSIEAGMGTLTHLVLQLWGKDIETPVCQFFDCPRLVNLESTIEEAVDVIDKTRRAFKSKDLANLRARLETSLGKKVQNTQVELPPVDS